MCGQILGVAVIEDPGLALKKLQARSTHWRYCHICGWLCVWVLENELRESGVA